MLQCKILLKNPKKTWNLAERGGSGENGMETRRTRRKADSGENGEPAELWNLRACGAAAAGRYKPRPSAYRINKEDKEMEDPATQTADKNKKNTHPLGNEFVTYKEAGEMLCVSAKTFLDWSRTKTNFPAAAIKYKNNKLWKKADIESWINNLKAEAMKQKRKRSIT